ncbi:hypothetical protein GGI15_003487 [Coemansia interrupta]|uniref:RCC1-like domain-containing protein n=1 Tax=Coemansia interrupta TaxID=1126814 RepID=A0A9W8HCB1_9FUNG|nr:hypothetical protein GGI15_003487 [Coemansia interrupta]
MITLARLHLPRLRPHTRTLATVTAWGAYVGAFADGASPPPRLEPASLDVPAKITLPLTDSARIHAVGAGVRHALIAAADSSGGPPTHTQLLGFGLNRRGQLGAASTAPPTALVQSLVPGRVVQIACGREHSALLTRSPAQGRRTTVMTCGANAHGQLGYATAEPFGDLWRPVEALDGLMLADEAAAKVQCGLDHTLVLTTHGRVFAMGWGADGQLGAGPGLTGDSADPVLVHGLPHPVIDISASTDFALAIDATGALYYWGNAEYGQAMTGARIDQVLVPTRAHLAPAPVVAIAAAGTLALAVAGADRSLYVCGYGALGLGPERTATLEPLCIAALGAVSRVWATTDRCLALDADGRLHSWGLANAAGRLGLATDTARGDPLPANVFAPQPLPIDPGDIDPDLVALGNDIALIAKNHTVAE